MPSMTTVRNPNTGHGHVRPRPDGVKARCGGPTMCSNCAREQAAFPSLAPIAPDSALPHWIQTLPRLGERVGRVMNLLDPTPHMVDFRTIAAVCARVARFGGHTGGGVLSVAQHQEQGARAVLRDTGNRLAAAAFLIHDAHEAYIGDIATPVARALGAHAERNIAKDYAVLDVPVPDPVRGAGAALIKWAVASLKSTLDAAIYPAAGLPWPLPPDVEAIVKSYDLRMGRTERDARMATPPHAWEPAWENAEPVSDIDTYPWSAGSAEAFYWTALREMLPALSGQRVDSLCDNG